MSGPRILLLFDERARPSSWNERMVSGEYAVHESELAGAGFSPSCTVFSSLIEAEMYAREETERRAGLRCRIYDHQGFVGAPIREFRGSAYKGESEISVRFRRWVGVGLFFGGVMLILIDWAHDFGLSWPAMVGARLLMPGLVLLVTEAVLLLVARRKKAQGGVLDAG